MTEETDISGEFRHDLKQVINTGKAKNLDDLIQFAEKKGFREKAGFNLPLTHKQERLMGKVLNKYGDSGQKETLARVTRISRRGTEYTLYRNIVTGRFAKKPSD